MNRVLLYYILILCGSALHAQQFSTPRKVNSDEPIVSARNPFMSVDKQGTIDVAWIKKGNLIEYGPIFFSRSTDRGQTFSSPTAVYPDANAVCDHQQTPEFVIDSKGYIHMVWSAQRIGLQNDIWYSTSFDNGVTWSNPINVCDEDDSSLYFQDYPSIAVDSNDNLYVSFLDARATQRKQTGVMQLFMAKSTDHGISWSKNVRADMFATASYGTCESARQKIAVTKNGDVVIAFRSNVANSRDIYLARSYDGGKTFTEPLKVQNGLWLSVTCPFTGPSLSLDKFGGAHIGWYDARMTDSSQGHSYYAYVPYGSNDNPPNIIIDTPFSNPYTAVVSEFPYPNFRVLLYQTGIYGLRYQFYANDTLLVSDTKLAPGRSQQNANIAFASDGTRYIVWQDSKRSSEGSDIYFIKDSIPIAIDGVKHELTTREISLWPQPATESASVTIPSTTVEDIYISDLLGNEFHPKYFSSGADTYTIDLRSIVAGTYYLYIRSPKSTILLAQKLIVAK